MLIPFYNETYNYEVKPREYVAPPEPIPLPEFAPMEIPAIDYGRIEQLKQQIASPAYRKLRSQLRDALAQKYKNPTMAAFAMKKALEGYGEGLGNVMSGASGQANSAYQMEYQPLLTASKADFENKRERALMGYKDKQALRDLDWQQRSKAADFEYERGFKLADVGFGAFLEGAKQKIADTRRQEDAARQERWRQADAAEQNRRLSEERAWRDANLAKEMDWKNKSAQEERAWKSQLEAEERAWKDRYLQAQLEIAKRNTPPTPIQIPPPTPPTPIQDILKNTMPNASGVGAFINNLGAPSYNSQDYAINSYGSQPNSQDYAVMNTPAGDVYTPIYNYNIPDYTEQVQSAYNPYAAAQYAETDPNLYGFYNAGLLGKGRGV